jgi:hypothetical protein
MTRAELIAFLRKHMLMVVSSSRSDGAPQAAVVGFVVSDELELFFDTLSTSRKCAALRNDGRCALVVGWDDKTAQIEGVADEPGGADLDRLKRLYFAAFPDGVERERTWPDLTYFRVRPTWARFSDFSAGPNKPGHVVEVTVTG